MTATQAPTTISARGTRAPKRKGTPHRKALVALIAPFATLFFLLYLLPIGYAFWQSLLVIERDGTFGKAREVFGGFQQYEAVMQNDAFWQSMGRMALFGIVQVPVMLGLALVFALLLDSSLLKGRRFFRLAFFVPYAVPGVIAAIMWGNLLSPNVSPFKALTSRVDLLGADLVLWSIANVVTWVFVGYNMLIIYSALLAIPVELYEAARLDGASQARIAWSIKIPLVAPAITLTAFLSIIGTLQLLAEPQVFKSFTSTVTSTFTPNLTIYSTAAVPNVNLAAALSVVLAVFTFALSFGVMRLTQRKVEA